MVVAWGRGRSDDPDDSAVAAAILRVAAAAAGLERVAAFGGGWASGRGGVVVDLVAGFGAGVHRRWWCQSTDGMLAWRREAKGRCGAPRSWPVTKLASTVIVAVVLVMSACPPVLICCPVIT